MGKHEKERDGFKSRTGFILACIGSAVGMGTVSYTHLTLPTT